MADLNTQYTLVLGKSVVRLSVNDGFINSSFVSKGNLHMHPMTEIHFMLQGSNQIKTEATKLWMRPGQILLVPPKLSHAIIPVANPGQMHQRAAFWVQVEGNDEFAKTLGALSELRVVDDVFSGGERVKKIQQELTQQPRFYEERLKSEFSCLLIDLYRQMRGALAGDGRQDAQKSQMIMIEDYIQKHYADDCTGEALAKRLSVSRRQLTRVMQALYGKGFRRLLTEMRMSMANYYLEESDYSPEEIAEKIGYGSKSAFYHAYGDFFHHPPNVHRLEMRKD